MSITAKKLKYGDYDIVSEYAINDSQGNEIVKTYATKSEIPVIETSLSRTNNGVSGNGIANAFFDSAWNAAYIFAEDSTLPCADLNITNTSISWKAYNLDGLSYQTKSFTVPRTTTQDIEQRIQDSDINPAYAITENALRPCCDLNYNSSTHTLSFTSIDLDTDIGRTETYSYTLSSGGEPANYITSITASYGNMTFVANDGTSKTWQPTYHLRSIGYPSMSSTSYGSTNSSWTYKTSFSGGTYGKLITIKYKASADYGGVALYNSSSSFTEANYKVYGISTSSSNRWGTLTIFIPPNYTYYLWTQMTSYIYIAQQSVSDTTTYCSGNVKSNS